MSEAPLSSSADLWPVVVGNKNLNAAEAEATPKRPINVMFLITTFLFSLGLILNVASAIMTKYLFCHARGPGKCDSELLEHMKFPGKTKHTAAALEGWARKFNDIRKKNKNLDSAQLIPRSEEEVCITFEKYPGLYNKHAVIEGDKLEETSLKPYTFFSFFLFTFSASLMFFVILFIVAEHLMILKGGDAFENMKKCSLISGLICALCTIIGCALLGSGLAQINEQFLAEILTKTCKYNISTMNWAALGPAAVAALSFLVAAPLSIAMYRE